MRKKNLNFHDDHAAFLIVSVLSSFKKFVLKENLEKYMPTFKMASKFCNSLRKSYWTSNLSASIVGTKVIAEK